MTRWQRRPEIGRALYTSSLVTAGMLIASVFRFSIPQDRYVSAWLGLCLAVGLVRLVSERREP